MERGTGDAFQLGSEGGIREEEGVPWRHWGSVLRIGAVPP
jgi:hypothetical protein